MSSDKKYLILKGCAGLGNRLYTVCAAIEYSLRNDRVLYVDWSDGQFDIEGMNAFYKHFELIDVPHVDRVEALMGISKTDIYPSGFEEVLTEGIYKSYLQDASNLLQRIPQRLIPKGRLSKIYGYWRKKEYKGQVVSRTDRACLRAIPSTNHFIMGQFLPDDRKESLIVFVDFCPPFDFSFFRKHVRLKLEVEKELIEFVTKMNLHKAIGLHIRNTDKKPTSSFHDLRERLKDFDFESIFLATDDKKLEEEIISWGYPVKRQQKFMPEGRRGLHQWALDEKRDDVKEQMFKESIIDMYALSKCKFLLFQGNSSFSCMSDLLRGQVHSADWQSLS